MELTGKCLTDFEKWYEQQRCCGGDTGRCNPIFPIGLNTFYKQHESMQYGVYVDFFDSVGIEITIEKNKINDLFKVIRIEYFDNDFISEPLTRQEAREQAIEKANELYNNK